MSTTARAPSLSIVIPAFNEEQRIPGLIEELAKSAETTAACSGFTFLEGVIADDGSSDGTPSWCRGRRRSFLPAFRERRPQARRALPSPLEYAPLAATTCW